MEIGKALKEIRENLGLNLNEMSAGVITASHYSKIEKGHHRLSAEDLLQILAFHSIDAANLLRKLNDKDEVSLFKQMNQDIINYFYQGNLSSLYIVQQKIAEENNLDDQNRQYLLALTESSIYSLDESQTVSTDTKEFIKEKLFQLPNWNSFKLTLYTNFMEFYSLDSNKVIIDSILSKEMDNYSANEQTAILSILLNYIGECIELKKYKSATDYLKKIDLIHSKPDNFFYKILGVYYENIIRIIKTDDPEGHKKLKNIIQVTKISGLDFFGEQLDEYLTEKREW